jgi:hypothetical protein
MMARFDIEEILYEAHALGLREEVLRIAKQLIGNSTYYDISEAYEDAYQYCLTNIETT